MSTEELNKANDYLAFVKRNQGNTIESLGKDRRYEESHIKYAQQKVNEIEAEIAEFKRRQFDQNEKTRPFTDEECENLRFEVPADSDDPRKAACVYKGGLRHIKRRHLRSNKRKPKKKKTASRRKRGGKKTKARTHS